MLKQQDRESSGHSDQKQEAWRVVSVRTRDDLQAVLPAWRAFQQSQPIGATFYNDPDRIDQWLQEFPEAVLRTQLVYHGSRLAAVAPMIAEHGRIRLTCGPVHSPTFRYQGAVRLGDEFVYDQNANVVDCLNWMVRGLGDDPSVQGIYLRNVDLTSLEAQHLGSSELRKEGLCAINPRVVAEPSHSIDVLPSFAQYEAQLSRKRRYLFRRMWRLLNEAYPQVQVDCVTTVAQVPQFLDDLDFVYRRTWQGQAARSSAGRNLPRQIRRFQWIAEQGWLRSYVLRSGATPLAYLIGYQYHGQHEIQETGYDPDHRQHSPGSVLWWYSIKDLHEANPPDRIRFGWGDFPYKRTLSTRSFPAGEVYLVRSSWLAALLRAQRSIHWATQSVVKPLLRRTPFLRRRSRQAGDGS